MAERTTSFAKSVEGLVHKESPLDRAHRLLEKFNDRAPERERQQQKETERPDTGGSPMVKADTPVMRPTPNGPMRQRPDMNAAYARLAQERAQAAKKNIAAREAHARARANDRDRER